MANIVKSVGDKAEYQRDEYTKEGMPIDESVDIAVDQAIETVCGNSVDRRSSFAGHGPGVQLGIAGKVTLTAKEFSDMMRKSRGQDACEVGHGH